MTMNTSKLWLTEEQDSLASALGSDATHLMLHHRDELQKIADGWMWQTEINSRWTRLYGADAVQYQRNEYFVLDQCGSVLAGGSEKHCMEYMRDGRVLLIRVNKNGAN